MGQGLLLVSEPTIMSLTHLLKFYVLFFDAELLGFRGGSGLVLLHRIGAAAMIGHSCSAWQGLLAGHLSRG